MNLLFRRAPSEWGGRRCTTGGLKGASVVLHPEGGSPAAWTQLKRQAGVHETGPGWSSKGRLLRALKHRRNTAHFLSDGEHSRQSVKMGWTDAHEDGATTDEAVILGWWPGVAGGGGEKSADRRDRTRDALKMLHGRRGQGAAWGEAGACQQRRETLGAQGGKRRKDGRGCC